MYRKPETKDVKQVKLAEMKWTLAKIAHSVGL